MFQRFFDEGLAQASYLIACSRTRESVVVDPRRDIDVYVEAARQRDLTLTHAIETHVHADFVSGARELAALGARPIAGPGAGLGFEHHEVRNGERLRVGDIQLEFLHTPGHTPEHVSILVNEAHQPVRALTGDLLFVGAVGRPDLLGEDLSRRLANQLHTSLFDVMLALDDRVEVHPGHGAGSLCGAGIGSEPHSTIGQERRLNPMLQHSSKDAFVDAVLADLPETPPYFRRMKRVNQQGPPVLGLHVPIEPPRMIRPAETARMAEHGAIILDLRAGETYGSGHPPGAVNIGFGARVGYWAGWVVPAESPLILLAADDRQAAEARRQLLRVGLDDVAGTIDDGFEGWQEAGLPVAHTVQMTAGELQDRLAREPGLTVIDVRTEREWNSGHIEGAIHAPVGALAAAVPLDGAHTQLATICEGGQRSSLAASLLERAGVSGVINVTGGMAAYRTLEVTK